MPRARSRREVVLETTRGTGCWLGYNYVSNSPIRSLLSARSLLDEQLLTLARDCLLLGDLHTGRQLADWAVHRIQGRHNRDGRGRALLTLAQFDMQDSRLRSAFALSNRAARQFELSGNQAGQAEALALSGYSASALHFETAGDIAQRSALLHQAGSELAQATALNYLGVAWLWARDFDGAAGVLEAAVWYADGHAQGATAFQPKVNWCFTEALRVFSQPLTSERDLTRLFALLAQCHRRLISGDTAMLNASAPSAGLLALLEFSFCFAHARAGQLERALPHALACEAHARQLPARNWGRALAWWARCELAMARKDRMLAAMYARQVVDVARAGEHARMAGVGCQLLRELQDA